MRSLLKPRLVVLDLDHTVWPFGVDQMVYKPPYRKNAANKVEDATGKLMEPFPGAIETLKYLAEEKQFPIAIASRTETPELAHSLLDLFPWSNLIKYRQIYRGSKIRHLNELTHLADSSLSEMIAFDDEQRNIDELKEITVFTVPVDPKVGLTKSLAEKAIEQFTRERVHKK